MISGAYRSSINCPECETIIKDIGVWFDGCYLKWECQCGLTIEGAISLTITYDCESPPIGVPYSDPFINDRGIWADGESFEQDYINCSVCGLCQSTTKERRDKLLKCDLCYSIGRTLSDYTNDVSEALDKVSSASAGFELENMITNFYNHSGVSVKQAVQRIMALSNEIERTRKIIGDY